MIVRSRAERSHDETRESAPSHDISDRHVFRGEIADQPRTLPPFLRQADFDFSGNQPMPLQEFCPLQALDADLHAPMPLQLLMPEHMTVFEAACAPFVAAIPPPNASATAASAMLPPETTFILILLSLTMRPRGAAASGARRHVRLRCQGPKRYMDHAATTHHADPMLLAFPQTNSATAKSASHWRVGRFVPIADSASFRGTMTLFPGCCKAAFTIALQSPRKAALRRANSY
jgi:hypothetical protein